MKEGMRKDKESVNKEIRKEKKKDEDNKEKTNVKRKKK